jgi:preprotein translocase subunit SecA
VLARAFERDRDYLVADGQITQIDQRSGRPSPVGFPERLHGAYGPQALGELQRRGRELYADMVARVKRKAINKLFKTEINLKGNRS